MSLLARIALLAVACAALWPTGAAAQAPQGPAAPAPPSVSRFLPPLLQRHFPASYPKGVPAGQPVVVTLELMVNEHGRVVEAKVMPARASGLEPQAFQEAALKAARHLAFFPGLADGKPVKVRVTYAYRFAAGRAPAAGPGAKRAAPARASSLAPRAASAPASAPASALASAPASAPATQAVAAAPPVRLRGRVRERGTKEPIAEARVEVRPAAGGPPVVALADDDGAYAVRGLAAGSYRVVVTATDFRRLEVTETVGAREAAVVDYYLEATRPRRRFETVISGRAAPEEVQRHVLDTEEIVQMPGTGGDALRAIENMPGVARSSFGIGQLIILGSSPFDSLVALEGHYMPQLYHFGGLTSIINSDLIERIDFVPSNFGVRYGNATGGLVDVGIRDPKSDRLHAYVRSSIPLDTTVLVEGPVGKGSFAVSARRSYVDAFLPLFVPKDAGVSMTAAPVYWDYQGILVYPRRRRQAAALRLRHGRRAQGRPQEPAGLRPQRARRHLDAPRSSTAWRRRTGSPGARGTSLASAQLGYQQQDFNLGPDIFLSGRPSTSRGASRRSGASPRGCASSSGSSPGAGATGSTCSRRGRPRGSQQIDFSETLTNDVEGCYWSAAAYVQMEAEVSKRVTLVPGVRFEYFKPTWGVDPRLVVRVKIDKATTVKAGAGIFHQQPVFIYADSTYGNGDLYQQTAYHFSAGFERTLRPGLTVESTLFFKWLTDLGVPSTLYYEKGGQPIPEVFNNAGVGRVYGAEVLLRQQPVGRFFGWLSYTVLKSERRDGPGLAWYPFDYDQTHILTLLGSVKLGRGWEAGLRFRYVTGNPWKVLKGGVYDADNDTYRQLTPRPSIWERLPAYHQLDLRVDKKFVFQKWMLTAFVDVQNVYYHANVEETGWNYDFTRRTTVKGLPILPQIGVKGEY